MEASFSPVSLNAVGLIEFNSIAAGIEAADYMLKASQVEPLMLKTICPGKFVVGVHGMVASVEAAMQAGLASSPETTVDHFTIPNITPEVITAMSCGVEHVTGAALAVIETFSVASTIVAADTAAKTADVQIAEVRIAMGLGGKAFTLLSGDIAAVQMAADSAADVVAESAMLVRKTVIPGASPQLLRHIL